MATYAERPDGMLDVTLDDGTRVPMALSVDQAVGAGLMPATPQEAQGDVYAQPAMPEPPRAPGAMADVGRLSTMSLQQGPPAVPDVPFRPLPAGATAPPAPAPIARPEPGPAAPAGPRGPVVPVGMPSQSAQQGPTPEQEARASGEAVFKESMRPLGGPARRIPAQDIRAQFEVQKAAGRSPEDEEALAGARADVAEAKLRGADLEEQTLGVQARLQSEEIKRENDAYQAELRRRAGMEREFEDRRQEIDARLARAREMDERGTAKERVWQDKGWFGRILASLSIALGHLGTANGGPNLAKQILDEEVAAEEKRHQDLLESVPERSALKDMVDLYGNPELARQELRLRLKEQALAKSQYWATRAAGSNAQQQFDEWLAQLGNEVATDRDALNRAVAGQVAERWQHVPERVVGGYRQPTLLEGLEKGARGAEAARKIVGASPEEAELEVPGLGQARGKEEGKAMRDIQADYLGDKRALDELQAMTKDPKIKLGIGKRGTPEYHRARALYTQIETRIAKSYGGVVTDSDRQAAAREFADPTRMLEGANERLDQYRKKLDRDFRSKVQTKVRGAPPIDPRELAPATAPDRPSTFRER